MQHGGGLAGSRLYLYLIAMSTQIQSEEQVTPLAIRLEDRAVIVVMGEEAASFLNNLVTANIAALPPGHGTLAALLTPQGKIIADMLVFNASEGGEPLFLIDCGAGFVEDLLRRLTLYKLRAKVNITRPAASIGVLACLGAKQLPDGDFYAFADPRHKALGMRVYGEESALGVLIPTMETGTQTDYHTRRIALGVPEAGRDYAPLSLFPHEANLDRLGGVDFKKGCYVGQEVVSRMEHRGLARTRAVVIRFENGLNALDGAEVMAGESRLGFIGHCAGSRAIAFLRLDRVEEAIQSGLSLTAGGMVIHVEQPLRLNS
jgi:tRNA-modifying protein YgfZ